MPEGETATGDTVRYVNSIGVDIDLRRTTGQFDGDAAGDVLTGIENVVGSLTGIDHIIGTDGANRIAGLGGNDILTGLGGMDVMDGGAGDDTLYGDAGQDNLTGGEGADTLYGGDDKDLLSGGAGNDTLDGGAGNDTLDGGAGNDTLSAGAGDDILGGGDGADSLIGGDGADQLTGGAGNDQLEGGAGDDIYVFDAATGQDRIVDGSGKNQIAFDSAVSYNQLWLSRSGADLIVGVIGSTDKVTVENYFAAQGSTVHSIMTTTHVLYLAYAGDLIDEMTDVQVAAPGALPPAIAAMLAAYWYEGGNEAPTAAPIALTIDEDTPSELTGLGVVDRDDDISSYELGTAAQHGTVDVDEETGQFVYTPVANFHGADAFTIIATDAIGQTVEVAISVTVDAVNDDPDQIGIVGGGTLQVSEHASGGAAIGQLASTDVDGDTLTYTLVQNPGGLFQLSSSGVLTVDFLPADRRLRP